MSPAASFLLLGPHHRRTTMSHILTKSDGNVSFWSSVVRLTITTYCDVPSHKLWDLIVCWVDNNVEGDMGRAVFAV